MEALRGEIGASMVKSRIMETMLGYMLDTLAGQFTDVKQMMEDTILRERGRWYDTVNEYREELGLTWKELRALEKPTLKEVVKDYDTRKWYEGMSNKSSLRFYIQEKEGIHYDLCYRNSIDSTFYARARINALKLEEQKGRGRENYNKRCKLCGEEDEDMVHFIVKCRNLEEKRDYDLLNAVTRDPEEKMRVLLFRDDRRQSIGKMIRNLWECRRKQLKEIEKRGETSANLQPIQVATQGCKNSRDETQQLPKPTTQGCKKSRNEILQSSQTATQGCNKKQEKNP